MSRGFGKAAAALLALALLYAGPGLLPGRLLVPLDGLSDLGAWKADPSRRAAVSNRLLSDPVFQFIPWDAQARRAIRAGRFPWVNPFAAGGRPLWANPQAAVLSPFTWPRLLFGLRGWALSVLLKLLVAGLGGYALTRELSASRREAFVSGAVFMTGGFTVVWGLHPQTNVSVLLPGLLASLLALRRDMRPRRAAAVAALAALATAGGHPETLALGVCAAAAFFLWVSAAEPNGRAKMWPALAAGFGSLLAGFLLLAAQIVPFLLILPSSGLAAHRSVTAAAHVRWEAVAGQWLPGDLGSPLAREIDLTAAVPGGSAIENFNWRNSAYVGALGLSLLLLAGRRLDRRFRRARLAGFAALVVVWRFPFFASALHRIPVLGLAVPEWWSAAALMFLAAAVGPALTVVAASRRPRAALVCAVAGGALLAAGFAPSTEVGASFLRREAEHRITDLQEQGFLKLPARAYEDRMASYLERAQWTAIRRAALPGLAAILFAMGLAAGRRREPILAAAVLGELLAFGLGYLPSVPRSAVPGTPPSIAYVRARPGRDGFFLAAAPEVYPPDLATRAGVRDVRSFDGLESPVEIARLETCGYSESEKAFPPLPSARQLGCLERLGVRFYLTREGLPGRTRAAGGPPPAAGVYELKGAKRQPFPADEPPDGLAAGLALSAVGALVCAFVSVRLRSYFARSRPRPA